MLANERNPQVVGGWHRVQTDQVGERERTNRKAKRDRRTRYFGLK
jgi:hypothetical protein